MPLSLILDTVNRDMIAMAIESSDEETNKAVEFALVFKEDEHGLGFIISAMVGKEQYEIIRVRAPMEIYDKGWKHEWRTS